MLVPPWEVGATSSGKSWICHCNCVTTLWAHFCVCRHAECLQMYAVSAPFELVLNFPLTFSKLKPEYGRAPHPWRCNGIFKSLPSATVDPNMHWAVKGCLPGGVSTQVWCLLGSVCGGEVSAGGSVCLGVSAQGVVAPDQRQTPPWDQRQTLLVPEADTPPPKTATAADGTQTTGIYSCSIQYCFC